MRIQTSLIYNSFDKGDKAIATDAILNDATNKIFISSQVLIEFANVCIKKNYCRTKLDLESFIVAFNKEYNVIVFENAHILKAIELREHFKVSFFDSLIIATALQAGCEVLYTEDMHHGLRIERKLQIVNPFI